MMGNLDSLRFSDEFWMLFFTTINEMFREGLMPEIPDQESAELFFAQLAAKMIEMSESSMPPLDETIAIVQHIMRNEIVEIDAAIRRMEAARDN